ncbi:MAG: methyltransferase [Sandaracinus sp.]|nr:methyltransferase [Sandaracinus sp.]
MLTGTPRGSFRPMDLGAELDEALRLLAAGRDLLLERPHDETAPAALRARDWDDALGAMDDEALAAAERDPAGWLAVHGPAELRPLAGDAAALIARHREPPADPRPQGAALHVAARKKTQIGAFVEVLTELEGAERVVDFGSGHGHLTRALGEALRADTLGVERDPALVARARELGGRFVRADAEGFALQPGDVVVGLHPCGSLGDALVRRAREAGAHVLMVSCCFQKVPGPERTWLAERAAGFALPRDVLGLANLAPRSFRNSGSLEAKRGWRQNRLAVRRLLLARGIPLGPGDEGRGVTKERFRAGLADAAARSLERRGLPPASEDELRTAAAEAARIHARVARFALPRHALARVLELAIVLDRAVHLEEAGWAAEVRTLFSPETSPRNLAVVGRAPA